MGDLTAQWVGPQRTPRPDASFDSRSASELEPGFVVANGQISRSFTEGKDLYFGVENILNLRQSQPIVASALASDLDSDEFQNNMDASLVYGPIFGRMVYVGARFTMGQASGK